MVAGAATVESSPTVTASCRVLSTQVTIICLPLSPSPCSANSLGRGNYGDMLNMAAIFGSLADHVVGTLVQRGFVKLHLEFGHLHVEGHFCLLWTLVGGST